MWSRRSYASPGHKEIARRTEQTPYPLRLPRFFQEAVAKVAEREGTSVDQFIAIAVAEKLSALDTQAFSRNAAVKPMSRRLTALCSAQVEGRPD